MKNTSAMQWFILKGKKDIQKKMRFWACILVLYKAKALKKKKKKKKSKLKHKLPTQAT